MLFEDLKFLGGAEDDIYVRTVNGTRIDPETYFEPGDIMRLQTKKDGSPVRSDEWYYLQHALDVQCEKQSRQAIERYDELITADGIEARRNDFVIIWNPRNVEVPDLSPEEGGE